MKPFINAFHLLLECDLDFLLFFSYFSIIFVMIPLVLSAVLSRCDNLYYIKFFNK